MTDWNDGHAMDGFTEFLYDYADEHAPAESERPVSAAICFGDAA